jgi:hypothetical protein
MMNKFSLFTGGITSNNENGPKLATKPTGPKRRALGDITNGFADDEIRDPTAKKSLAIASESLHILSDEMTISSENRPYMQRPCDEIDSRDNDNPLLVTCYVNEIYDHFNNVEKEFRVNPNYMMKQEFINDKMRSILVDWLVSNCSNFLLYNL